MPFDISLRAPSGFDILLQDVGGPFIAVKYWDGGAWITETNIKVWDGGSWIPAVVKVWDGSDWLANA